jgi:hypothetical protein
MGRLAILVLNMKTNGVSPEVQNLNTAAMQNHKCIASLSGTNKLRSSMENISPHKGKVTASIHTPVYANATVSPLGGPHLVYSKGLFGSGDISKWLVVATEKVVARCLV